MGLFQWLAPGAVRVNRLCSSADATALSDRYGAAHCVTGVTDAKCNSVTYILVGVEAFVAAVKGEVHGAARQHRDSGGGMVYLRRRAVGLLLAVVLGMLWTPAHASFPATPDPSVCSVAPCVQYGGQNLLAFLGYTLYPSAQAVCDAYLAAFNAHSTATVAVGIDTCQDGDWPRVRLRMQPLSGAEYLDSYKSFSRLVFPPRAPVYRCPANSTLSGSPKSITVGSNVSISTAQSKFGGSALYFPGSASLAVGDVSGTTFWASDWTVEFWAATAVPAQGPGAVFGNRDFSSAGTGGGQIYLSYSGGVLTGITFEIREGPSWAGFGVGVSTPGFASARVASGFDHIAVTKQGLTYAFFLDGVKLNGITRAVPPTNSPLSLIYVGAANRDEFFPYFFNGYVDDFRITMGTPRYVNNFFPPVAAFPETAAPIDPNATGQTAGDLQSITNAAGHVTQFTLYDRAGRVRQMVDPKGVVTDTVYTPRGGVSSVTVTPPSGTARITTYTYDNAGQLTGVAMSDATTMSYSYDAAHRLTGVTDAKGNSVTYTLDAMGNKTVEQVKDPSGNLQRNITRAYDALNRVQQVTGASN